MRWPTGSGTFRACSLVLLLSLVCGLQPASWAQQATKAQKAEAEKILQDCQAQYGELRDKIKAQSADQNARVQNTIKAYMKRFGDLSPSEKTAVIGAIAALSAFSAHYQMRTFFAEQVSGYFAKFYTPNELAQYEVDLKRYETAHRQSKKAEHALKQALQRKAAPKEIERLRKAELEAIEAYFQAGEKFVNEKNNLHQEFNELLKGKSKKIYEETVLDFKKAHVEAGSADDELLSKLVNRANRASEKQALKAATRWNPRWMSSVAAGLVAGVATDVLLTIIHGGRPSPEDVWSRSVQENPALLLDVYQLERSDVLHGNETAESVACLAFQRFPDRMRKASHRLLAQFENRFQEGLVLALNLSPKAKRSQVPAFPGGRDFSIQLPPSLLLPKELLPEGWVTNAPDASAESGTLIKSPAPQAPTGLPAPDPAVRSRNEP